MKLADDERDVILAEVEEMLSRVTQPEARERYAGLHQALLTGELPDEFSPVVERIVELGLESGRIREIHSAHGEMAAQRFYRRTEQAQTIRKSLDDVSQALSGLTGQTLEQVSISLNGPGSFSIALSTDQGRMLIYLDRQGAELRSVEVG